MPLHRLSVHRLELEESTIIFPLLLLKHIFLL